MRHGINVIIMTMLVLVSTVYSVEAGNIGIAVINTASTIQRASFAVVSPNGGENWVIGTTHNIKWSPHNHNTNVKIELFKAGILNRTISVSTTNDGSNSWKIPSTQALGSDYRVKITNLSNMADYDFSDANFAIISPNITVVTPNGGENWARRHAFTIKWDHLGNTGSHVRIELFRGNTLSRRISSNANNDGSYRWTIPFSQAIDSNYRIKISSTSHSEFFDWSDNYFRIS